MRRTYPGILCLVGVAACGGESESSVRTADDEQLVLSSPPSCEACRIELREVARLGDAADPASVRADGGTMPCLVARDPGGGFLMSGPVGGGQVVRYDSEGRWSATLGRAGEGPGEFGRDLAVFIGSSDSIYVVDNSRYRISVFEPGGGFLGSFPMPDRAAASVPLSSGHLLLHFRPTDSTEGQEDLFHIVDPSGAEQARFGRSTRSPAEVDRWTVGAHPDGGFWAGSQWEYEFSHWTRSDSLIRTITRDVDWFPAGVEWSQERFSDLYVSEPAPPQLMHIATDDHGLVWTYSWVPDRNWAPNSVQLPTPDWTRRNFDTVIEVIDLEEGVVLAALRSDELLRHACSDHLAYSVVETEIGDTRVRVLEPTLVRVE